MVSGLLQWLVDNIYIFLISRQCVSHSVMSESLRPMDCSLPGSSVQGIFPGILEWIAISSSRGSSQPRDQTQSPVSPTLTGRFFTVRKLRMEVSSNCLQNLVPKGLHSTSLQVQETKRIKRMGQAYLMDEPFILWLQADYNNC